MKTSPHLVVVQALVPLVIVARAGLEMRSEAPSSSVPHSDYSGTTLAPPSPGRRRTEIRVSKFQESALDYKMQALPDKARSLASVEEV